MRTATRHQVSSVRLSTEYRDAYSNLSKTTLSQQSKIFNEKKLKDSECSDLLNKVIYLLNQVYSCQIIVGRRVPRPREVKHVFQRDEAVPNAAEHAPEPAPPDLRFHQGAQSKRVRSFHCDFLSLERHPAIRQWNRQSQCTEGANQDHWWAVRPKSGEVYKASFEW